MLVVVWAGAAGGAALKLVAPGRFERASIAAYLLLGWVGLAALDPLLAALPPRDLSLLAGGGLLYSLGVAVHSRRACPTTMPFGTRSCSPPPRATTRSSSASPQPRADAAFGGCSRHSAGCSLLEEEGTGGLASEKWRAPLKQEDLHAAAETFHERV